MYNIDVAVDGATSFPIRLSSWGFAQRKSEGFARHSHPNEYEFHFFPKAQSRFMNGDGSHLIPDHALAFSEPSKAHSFEACENRTLSWFWIRFEVERAESFPLQRLRKAFRRRGYLQLGEAHVSFFDNLLTQLDADDEHARFSAEHHLMGFIFELTALEAKGGGFEGDGHTREVIRLMRRHLHEKIDLDLLAASRGIGKSHLIRIFHKQMGVPPAKYFHRLKMENAASQLRRTFLSVSEISDSLGFYDLFHFSKSFRRFHGVSPLAFRKNFFRKIGG